MPGEVLPAPVARRAGTPWWSWVDWRAFIIILVCLVGRDVLQHERLADIKLHPVLRRVHNGHRKRALWLRVHERMLLQQVGA